MKVRESRIALFVLGGIIVCLVGFLIWGYKEYKNLELLQTNTAKEKKIVEENLKAKTEESAYIFSKLTLEQQKNLSFENQIKEIASQVGTLDKLSKTDRELLKKYSKVYFLNENYIPEKLLEIPKNYLYDEKRNQQIHQSVLPFLENMLRDAESNGISLKIVSAYRSFSEQSYLKLNYKVTYGAGTANQFSADQGYSEHQLGTTLDFTTEKLGSSFTNFDNTDSYKWLLENAYKYGFVLSYPENNAFYQFEPWHWRFVGKKLANRMYLEKENFYDVDQRTIDNYLISIFDN